MINAEKYQNEIIKILKENHAVPAIKDGQLVPCDENIACADCGLNPHGDSSFSCEELFFKWCIKSENVLNQYQHAFCLALGKGYLFRDAYDNLRYSETPYENGGVYSDSYIINLQQLIKFPFIKKDSPHPFSIEEMINWPVEYVTFVKNEGKEV